VTALPNRVTGWGSYVHHTGRPAGDVYNLDPDLVDLSTTQGGTPG
jgi:hypothetical protein